jgi:hypothetical protein
LAQTIFDGGQRRAIVAETEAAYDATVAAYQQEVLIAFQDVEDNLAPCAFFRRKRLSRISRYSPRNVRWTWRRLDTAVGLQATWTS